MYRLGIDVGATKIAIGLMDEAAAICHRDKIPSARALGGMATVVDGLEDAVRAFCREARVELSCIEGVGIGFPGVMDKASGKITSCPNLPILDNCALGAALSERLGLPVSVENDVNLIALGEHLSGRGMGVDDQATVYVGSGIGCGLILDGKLYTGADGAAAELGHTIIEPEGLPCTCGGRGCLEMYCSGKALTLQAESILVRQGRDEARLSGQLTPAWTAAEQVIGAARSGHPGALEALRKAFYYLGLGIANLANLLDPRLVILGGGIVEGWPEGMEVVQETMKTRARTVVRDRLEIARPVLGEDAGLVGAWVLVGRDS